MPTFPSHQGCAAIHAMTSRPSSSSCSEYSSLQIPSGVAGAADVDAHAGVAVAGEPAHLLVVAGLRAVAQAVGQVLEDAGHAARCPAAATGGQRGACRRTAGSTPSRPPRRRGADRRARGRPSAEARRSLLDRGRSRAESDGVRRLLAPLLLAVVLPAAASCPPAERRVTVQGPAALAESGYVRAVLLPVARRHGFAVRYVSTDGAQSLTDLRAGEAGLALSDSEAAGDAFVAAKSSLEPRGRLVLYGDDVLVGPASDPAGVAKGAPEDIAAALRLVATAGRAGRADFVDGGTGRDESAVWQAAKVARGEQPLPVGERWYHYGAHDPAAVVRSTAACSFPSRRCYALVDRAVLSHAPDHGSQGARAEDPRRPQHVHCGGRRRRPRAPDARLRDSARRERCALAARAADLAAATGRDRLLSRHAGRPATTLPQRHCSC